MYSYREYINKKMLRVLMSGLLTALFLSGCDETQQDVSASASSEQAHIRNAQCYALPKAPVNIQNGSYPFWSDHSAGSNIQNLQSTLSDIEKSQDKTLVYYSLAIIIQADKATEIVSKETFTPQEAKLQVTALNSLIAEAKECYKATPPSDNASLIRYSFLLDSANQYSNLVAERIQRQQSHVAYSEGEKAQIGSMSEWMVKGSAGRVIRAYNKVVSSFNDLS
ncbi:DUF3829 domain-containing protein [Buttiauxella selenatireducens]|uniref:DUF3829 domain-containing protein n=1 Tax=Buttiauxella selenatireducens TaxID=3073902 RepID=A0ABY9SE85_9ENTR|nr:DUF3829 domain-containing protein [Buttiauxella sp. R73]WMY74452.1 DUF3829 domain-containing protein [Buttiauxella sp. R73]